MRKAPALLRCAPAVSLWGFILASEALLPPLLLVLYVPALAAFALLWQAWVCGAGTRFDVDGETRRWSCFGWAICCMVSACCVGTGDFDAVYCRRLAGYGNVESNLQALTSARK